MAVRLGLGGVVIRPSHYHVAYTARHHFSFVEPERQGRFEALVRDLVGLPLVEATDAVTEGRVLLDGKPYVWEADEMAYWLREAPEEPGEVARGKSPRARALEVFAALAVWDTEANNGVLIYVLLADRDVEIVADRGFNGRVAAAEWAAVCEDMQREFRAGRYAESVIAGVEDVGRIIGAHYPQGPGQRDEDELPNRPALL